MLLPPVIRDSMDSHVIEYLDHRLHAVRDFARVLCD